MKPTSKGRPRFAKNGHVFTPAKTRQAEAEFQYLSKRYAPVRPLTGPLRVKLIFGLGLCKRGKAKLPYGVSRDVDNMAKLTLDAMNKVMFVDDKQVIELLAIKKFSDREYIKVEITSLAEC